MIKDLLRINMSEKNVITKGKNYVCADIHGMYGSYLEALKQLKKSDHLWILGDAMDRGKNGIKIIKDIMKSTQVTYILGNHDALFINVIDIMKKYNISNDELKDIIKYRRERDRFVDLTIKAKSLENNEDIQQIEEEINKSKSILTELILRIREMQSRNYIPRGNLRFIQDYSSEVGAFCTIWEYATLSKEKQNDIYNFLINCYIISEQQIGDKKIILTHAQPPKSELEILTYKQAREKYGNSKVLNFLQERAEDSVYEKWKQRGYVTICGHTPSPNKIIDESNTKGLIRIDAGCARGESLALYCIEDGITKFIKAKEQIKGLYVNSWGGKLVKFSASAFLV